MACFEGAMKYLNVLERDPLFGVDVGELQSDWLFSTSLGEFGDQLYSKVTYI